MIFLGSGDAMGFCVLVFDAVLVILFLQAKAFPAQARYGVFVEVSGVRVGHC